jgi:competence protein ComEA
VPAEQTADDPATEERSVSISGKININTATLEQLDTLPGIGEITAQKIIDYRSVHGPFSNIEAIMDVDGIGEGTFEEIKNFISISDFP